MDANKESGGKNSEAVMSKNCQEESRKRKKPAYLKGYLGEDEDPLTQEGMSHFELVGHEEASNFNL